MKPIREQTILVTGATDGHGRGVALELADRGSTEQRALSGLRARGALRAQGAL